MLIRPAAFHFFKLTVILHGKFHIALSAGKPYLPKIHISEHNIISYPDSYILCCFLRRKKKSKISLRQFSFGDFLFIHINSYRLFFRTGSPHFAWLISLKRHAVLKYFC